jgi:cytochrome c oxidase cbb3-type subunit 4
MDWWYSFFGSALTVIALLAFLGICFWAYSSRRKHKFDEEAKSIFADPDDDNPNPSKPDGKPTN